MSAHVRALVRWVRGTRDRARFALGPSGRLVVPLAVLAAVAGFAEAGALALLAQSAFAMSTGGGAGTDAGPISFGDDVPLMLTIALALAVVRVGVQWGLAWLTARMASQTQARLRTLLFDAYTRTSWDVQSRDRAGHLQEVMTAQVRQAANGATIIASALAPAITFCIMVGSAVALSPLMAVLVLVAALGIFFVLRPFGKLARRHAAAFSVASLELAEGVGEAVHLSEEMQVFGTDDAHRRHVGGLIAAAEEPFFKTQLLALAVPTLHQGLALLLVIGGLAGLYAVGAEQLGSLGAIVLLLVRALSYAQQLQHAYQKLNDVAPFLERIADDIDRYDAAVPPQGEQLPPTSWDLSFEGVAYRYHGDLPVVWDIDFQVADCETVGVIGPSGAGKSTLVQLLLRLREPDVGTYRLNGTDVRDIDRHHWQRQVALVSQEPRLLSGTVADNIRYYRDWLSDDDIVRAAHLAHIHEEIVAWPDGYDHRIGQRLDAVSGGQRQRLCLARALAGRPRLLVLDEPTSALDPRSEQAIQESLRELRGAMTTFIVAHRMSTLSICDRIMVVGGGTIEAFGQPDDLWRAEGYFRSAMELSAVSVSGAQP